MQLAGVLLLPLWTYCTTKQTHKGPAARDYIVAVQSFSGLKTFLGGGHLLLCGSAASAAHANGQSCGRSSSAKGLQAQLLCLLLGLFSSVWRGMYYAGSVQAVTVDEVCLC
jgi:hypothetical protein